MTREASELAAPQEHHRFNVVLYWREALVLALVAIVAAADLTAPTLGDQALYLTYAKKLAAGGILYRDIWDIKQPGIFYFYLVAIRMFGQNAVSAHLLELIWMLGLALALQIGLRPYFSHRWTKALVALPTVALYYAVSAPFLGQVEGLLALPLFLTLWALNTAARDQHRRSYALFLAGVAAGVVLCFKLVYAIVIAALYLTAVLDIVSRDNRRRLATIGLSLGLLVVGALLPLAIVTSITVSGSGVETFFQTTFVDPGRILSGHPGAPALRFFQSAAYFIKIFAPIIILAAAGGSAALYRRDRLLTQLLFAWLISGLVGIVVQTWSWWEHHFLLLWIPIGVLATKWIDVALDWTARASGAKKQKTRVALVALGVTLLFMPAAVQPATNVYLMIRTKEAPWTEAGRMKFQSRRSTLYRNAYDTTAFLRDPKSKQEPIFVCGSPVDYVLGDRAQGLSEDGYSLDLQLPEQWLQFTSEFDAKRPVFVYIERECQTLLLQNSPGTIRILRQAYRVRQASADGSWYERLR